MDKTLRKRHKFIWIVLTPLLLVLLIWATKDLNFSQSHKTVNLDSTPSSVVAKAENEEIRAILLKNSEGNLLEIEVKSPLPATSSVVFALKGTSERESLLGQLEGVGTYRFQVEGDVRGILVQDVIKKQSVLKLEF